MVFFQLNVTGLLFQSFRTASPICSCNITRDAMWLNVFSSLGVVIFLLVRKLCPVWEHSYAWF